MKDDTSTTEAQHTGTDAFAVVEKVIVDTHRTVEASIAPVRETALRRYPTLFTVLATVGISMTFLGIEQLLLAIDLLNRHPTILLVVGIGILVATGTVYKKLS
jgi:uncharacterized membrane protein